MSKSGDPHVVLFKASSVVAMSRFLATTFAVLSLVVPVVVLYIVESTPQRLGIITVFTTIFSSLLCWLTQSRNYEIFSATAAYCAVMVVFVGSIPVT